MIIFTIVFTVLVFFSSSFLLFLFLVLVFIFCLGRLYSFIIVFAVLLYCAAFWRNE